MKSSLVVTLFILAGSLFAQKQSTPARHAGPNQR